MVCQFQLISLNLYKESQNISCFWRWVIKRHALVRGQMLISLTDMSNLCAFLSIFFYSSGAFASCLSTLKLGCSQGLFEFGFHVVSRNLWSSCEVVCDFQKVYLRSFVRVKLQPFFIIHFVNGSNRVHTRLHAPLCCENEKILLTTCVLPL